MYIYVYIYNPICPQPRHGWHNEPVAGFFHYAVAEAAPSMIVVKTHDCHAAQMAQRLRSRRAGTLGMEHTAAAARGYRG